MSMYRSLHAFLLFYWLTTCTPPTVDTHKNNLEIHPDTISDAVPGKGALEIGELNDSLILCAVFGNAHYVFDDGKTESWRSHWRYNQYSDTINDYPYEPSDSLTAEVKNITKFRGGKQCLVVFGTTAPEACHPCGGIIGGAVFFKTGAGWKANIINRCLLVAGSGGMPPEVQIKEFGKDRPVILLRSGYGNTGIYTETLRLAGLYGEKLKEIWCVTGSKGDPDEDNEEIIIHENNKGNCGFTRESAPYNIACYHYEATVSFARSNSTYYNMMIRYNGARPKEDNPELTEVFREKWVFRMISGKYIRIE